MDYQTQAPISPEMGVAMGGIMLVYMVIMFAVLLLVIGGMWKIFAKADRPGWAAVIPVYNVIVMLEIVGRPIWWVFVILFVPCVNIIFQIILAIDLAKSFGKDAVYGVVMLVLFPLIGYPMLGFGSAEYQGPSVAS